MNQRKNYETYVQNQASHHAVDCPLGSGGRGIRDGRAERVNLAVAGLAVTVLVFYFSSVMDKLGRSASLIGVGLLFLGGGWALERMRRRLLAHMSPQISKEAL